MNETRKIKKGDRVVFLNESRHLDTPRYYPPVGTVGQVLKTERDGTALVKWPADCTGGRGSWYADMTHLALVQTDNDDK